VVVKPDTPAVKTELVRTGPVDIVSRAHATIATQRLPLIATLILVIASIGAALFAAIRLFGLTDTNVTVLGRFHLSTLVIFIAMAFACLGFGLFLVGATGAFKGNAKDAGRTVGLDTAAPGLVVIVCATIVIYLAIDLVRPVAPVASAAPASGSDAGSNAADQGPKP
jgi:hypothetical protein